MKKGILAVIGIIVLGGVALFLLIQLLPIGKTHTNPPVVQEPNWDSPQTRELAKRACFDCHSNETTYPWYSSIAPVSWLVARDINEGRQHLNFSDIHNTQNTGREGREGRRTNEISKVIKNGEMPPWFYIVQHPDAKLSDAEKQQLIQGLQATLAQTQ
jgi:hypothetical protein